MTAGVDTRLSPDGVRACVADCAGPTLAFANDAALNGTATRGTNRTRDLPAAVSGPARVRSPWAAMVVAVVVVTLVLAVELWAARRVPAQDGTVVSKVAAEVSATLGDVTASSILIGPAD